MNRLEKIRWFRAYKAFDYGEEPKAMKLDEATRLAASLSVHDAKHFYRVEPANAEMTSFRVTRVSKAKEWARYRDRMVKGSKEESAPYTYSFMFNHSH